MAGVFVAPDDTVGDEAGPDACDGVWACCCGGMVFGCFCGELVAEEEDGLFWGEFMDDDDDGLADGDGLVTDTGALE